MADGQKPTPKDDALGVSFDEVHEGDNEQKKELDPKIYEVANKHLAPSEVPGQENVFNVSRAFNEDAVEMGTIVSDKKHKRTPLMGSLKSAFDEWWGKTRSSLDRSLEVLEEKIEEKEPKEKPSDTDRSETIQKAKVGTVQPPKEDHHVLIEKTKTLEKDAARVSGVPFIIKDEAPKPATWNSTQKTEAQPKSPVPQKTPRFETPDLRKDMVAPIVGKRITKDIRSFQPPIPKPEKSSLKEPHQPSAPEKKEETKPDSFATKLPPIKPREKPELRTAPAFVSPKVTTHSTYIRSQKESPVVSQTPPEKKELVSRDEETTPIPKRDAPKDTPTLEEMRARLSSQNSFSAPKITPTTREVTPPEKETVMHFETPEPSVTEERRSMWRTLLWIVVSVVLLGLVVIGILYVITSSSPEATKERPAITQTTEEEKVVVPSFFSPDAQVPIVLQGSKSAFLSTLRDSVLSAQNGVTQFYPIRQTASGVQNVSTDELFAFLNTGLRQNAVRVLQNVSMIGSVTTLTNEPFIIIRSSDFDTLFAGMLAWEPRMYEDLKPLFGTNVLEQETFTDAVRSNNPIRILYNDQGGEVLLYAFVNRTTVIITTSTSALSEILSRF